MEDNICAISTSLGIGAISMIRCNGPDVIKIVASIFKGEDLTKVPTHTIHYGFIVKNDEKIDEVLVSVMRAPKTYTKEDIVEINCHGGITTTNKVLELLLESGCRLALPGEFLKRAFLNGRIDLVEAEAVNDLIYSENEEARKFALNMMEGNLSKEIKDCRNILVDLLSNLEVNFDFPEETDNPEITYKNMKKDLLKIEDKLELLLKNSKNGSIIKNGIDVAIVGRPNVGKSSILNHLLDQEKAIVTDIAGTTRDIVEGTISLEGFKLNLIDTAGIRETTDVVEKIGVDKSHEIISSADLVLYVLSNNEEITPEDQEILSQIKKEKLIIFVNKDDQESKLDLSNLENVIMGNTINVDGLDKLKKAIIDKFNLSEIKTKDYNYLSNARQISLVERSLVSINNAIKSTEEEYPFEMIAIDIKEAFDLLGEIIGVTYKEELLDEMFSKFCLGK